MDQPAQLISIPLDLGIDVSISEQGGGKGAVSMVNFDFAAEGDVVPRGTIERLPESGDVNVAPGPLLPQPTVPAHRRASTVPLEVSCIARAATSARLFAAQAATANQYTLMVMTCRDESNAAAADDPDNYLEFVVYDTSGTVLTTSLIAPGAPIADVKVTAAVSSGGLARFYVTYVDPSANTLTGTLWAFDPVALTLAGTAVTTLFSSLDAGNWCSSVHAVERNDTGLSLFIATTSSGTLRYRVVSGLDGSAAAAVNTALTSANYTEMASCHADGIITVVTGHSGGATALGIYSFNDVTFSVSTHSQTFPTITLSRRVAVVPDDIAGSTNVLAFVELTNGTDAVYCNAGIGVLTTMGEMQNIRLADAGTWIEEDDLTADNSQHRVPLIGLTSAEAIKSNFRSHVIARVFFNSVTNAPRLSSAACVAHSDSGATYGRVEFSLPHTRIGPLPKYTFDGGPVVALPVLVVTRTTADRTITADGGIDVFDRAVRLTTITANAHAHRGIVKLGPNTYIGGSVPSAWDGRNLSPAGFPLPPHSVKADDSGVTGGGLPEGTFSYKIRQHYQDMQGTIFESPVVFLPTAIQLNPATHTPQLTLYPGVLWANLFTAQTGAHFGTDIFRNPDTEESGDLTSRKAFTISSGMFSPVVVFDDTRSASNIATGELLPDPVTGAITSGPLPALNHLWCHRSRLFGVDAFDPELVRFTTEYVAPTAPLWADELSLRVTNSGGPVIGGASLGDKLVAFQENQISVSAGEGPDGRGQGSFAYPESLRGVGALAGTQGAIVEVPSGVMFVHRTGIYHLGFDLALTFPGSKLTHKIGQLAPIKRAVYLASRAQVWFLTDGTSSGSIGSPHILVWDTTRSRWTTFSSSLGPFSDVIEVSGTPYLVDRRGRLLEAHSGSSVVDLDEDGNTVEMDLSVGLPKVRANNAQKVRLRKIHISGQSDDVDLNIAVAVTTHNESRGGNSEESTATYTFDLTNEAASFQLPLRAATQRCDSLQCTISVLDPDPNLTNQLKLSMLTYELSVLPGTGKAPVSKKPAVT